MKAPAEARDAVHAVGLAAAGGPRVTPVGWSYRGMVLAVAVLMAILPLLYGALVLGVFALMHHYAVEAAMALGLGWLGFLPLYAGPALVALAFTAFLLKPFVAPRATTGAQRIVTRSAEPGLYAFVDALCRLVGAPRPSVIELTCHVNAGADLRPGIDGLRRGEVVLTLGLPLVAGLDLRELAGVIAHELGHVSQRTGLRLLHVVRAMNRWFERAVYEQDAWDQALAALVASPWPGLRGFIAISAAALAMGVISFSRLLLWPLMVVARLASVALLRELELDADRVHATVVGSECFERTMVRMALLDEGTERAARTLEQAWAQGRLTDDLTALIVEHADALDASIRDDVTDELFGVETEWFSSHPSPAERVSAVAALPRDGLVRLGGPSTVLFRNFAATARRATLAEYRVRLGPEVHPDALVSTAWIRAQRAEIEVQERAALRFFGMSSTPSRPLSLGLSWMAPPGGFETECRTLREARAELVEHVPRAQRLLPLDRDGVKRQVAEVTLQELERHGSRRLACCLRLLEDGRGLEEIDGIDAIRARARELRAALVVFEPTLPTLAALGRERERIEQLGGSLGDGDPERSGWAEANVMRAIPRMAIQIGSVRAPLSQHPYPYPHARPGVSIGQYALEGLPDAMDPATVLETTHRLTQRLLGFYVRMLGELATMAEAVEAALGFEPLDLSPPTEADARVEVA